jgi:hypothetical protein
LIVGAENSNRTSKIWIIVFSIWNFYIYIYIYIFFSFLIQSSNKSNCEEW